LALFPLILGLLGTAVGFQASDQDAFLPELARQYLSPVMYVILIGAIVSAILSTVDTTLLAVSAIATRNVAERILPNLTETQKVRLGRALTATAGVVALIIAATGESIKALVEIASSFGSAGILVALLFGLHTKFGDQRAAVAALITGGLISIFKDGLAATSRIAFHRRGSRVQLALVLPGNRRRLRPLSSSAPSSPTLPWRS